MIDQNSVDLRSVLAGYKDNDVDSMHLRRQLMQLRELIKGDQYQSDVNAFLYRLAFKLWGWDGFDVVRDVGAVQMTGAHGQTANKINGIYVSTGKQHNDKGLFKKTSMEDRRQYWLCVNNDRKWVVQTTENVEHNNNKAVGCTVQKDLISPVVGEWRIFNADDDKKWKTSPALTCAPISAPDLLWTLDECDVVFRAITAGEIERCLQDARELYMQTSARHWSIGAAQQGEPLLDIVTQLDVVEQLLGRVLTLQQESLLPLDLESFKLLQFFGSQLGPVFIRHGQLRMLELGENLANRQLGVLVDCIANESNRLAALSDLHFFCSPCWLSAPA
jgi:hypothetical protein